jgi:hypothetical protein
VHRQSKSSIVHGIFNKTLMYRLILSNFFGICLSAAVWTRGMIMYWLNASSFFIRRLLSGETLFESGPGHRLFWPGGFSLFSSALPEMFNVSLLFIFRLLFKSYCVQIWAGTPAILTGGIFAVFLSPSRNVGIVVCHRPRSLCTSSFPPTQSPSRLIRCQKFATVIPS